MKRKEVALPILFSYGIGPFIFALIFYTLIWLFPGRQDLFYSSILTSLCIFSYVLNYKFVRKVMNLYSYFLLIFKNGIRKQPKVFILLTILSVCLYLVQLFAFPIIDNDSALYLNQSEAVYENKNLEWQNKQRVFINGGENYRYNYAIQPGIPNLLSSIYLFIGNGRYTYFTFDFLAMYYYFLLLFLYLYAIKSVTIKKSPRNLRFSTTIGILLFVFSWYITRSLIFTVKELIIYFLALFSLIVLSRLKIKRASNFKKLLLFGVLLGINSFINLHGVIIECIILFIYFLLSGQNFAKKLVFTVFVFLISLPFGGMEIPKNFGFIFLESIGLTKPVASHIEIFAMYNNLYQTVNVVSVNLKGKFQLLTNIGVFGFAFWLFLFVLAKYLKKIIKNNLLLVITVFMAIYYFVVIDPLSLNKNPISIVLWGSEKYAGLLYFLALIFLSVFMKDMVDWVTKVLVRCKKVLWLVFPIIIISIIFHSNIIYLGTKILISTIATYKDVSFYRLGVQNFYILTTILVLLFLIIYYYSILRGKYKLLLNSVKAVIIFSTVLPFFMTTVGKVPFFKPFSFIGKNRQQVLESTYFEGDVFSVFFRTEKLLNSGTTLATDYNEITLYNNNFFIIQPTTDKTYNKYTISISCDNNGVVLYKSGQVSLCEYK
ncbi:MAG: hypothetical protein ABSC49_02085 [Candidatus Microgenomates bacterium]|jgi:hypothetical protein